MMYELLTVMISFDWFFRTSEQLFTEVLINGVKRRFTLATPGYWPLAVPVQENVSQPIAK